MRFHPLAALALLSLALPGCAALSVESCDPAMRDPARLLELASEAIAQNDLELAYRYVGSVHALHPQSPENREAFLLAARLFRHNYMKHRLEFDSIWVASEPRFMISWLAGLTEDGGEFPQRNADALLLGLDGGLARQFVTYAQNHPRLSRWRVIAIDDDGIVQEIKATPLAIPSH